MAKHGNNIYKRKDGRWEGRIYFGKKYKSVYARSYSQVKEKLFALKSETNGNTVKCRMTVGEIFDLWLDDISYKVKEPTYYCYKSKLTKHLIPYFGHMKYEDLTMDLCSRFILSKLNEGFSPGYVSDMTAILKAAAKFARRFYNYENRIADLTPPKKERKEVQILSAANQRRLCSFIKKNDTGASLGILLGLYTGLRVGEICALQWKDIDFDKGFIHVRKTCERIPDPEGKTKTCVKIMPPKTASSVRQIPLPDFLYNILRERRSEGDNFVISGSKKCREPKYMQYRFKSILKAADIPPVRFHALRHTFATNCLQAGFDVKTLSEIMGHSNVQTTLNRYVHTSFERKCYCMSLLEMAI